MAEELKACPFCDNALFENRRRFNPYAQCVTEGCKGAQLPLLNLDMPEDITRWNTRAGLHEAGWGDYVRHDDYERLEQECISARHEKALWFSDLQKCRSELDAALKLLAQCQEHLDPHRDAVLWSAVVEALRCAPTK